MQPSPILVFLSAVSALLCGFAGEVRAAADLMVYPSRVVMTDRQRTAQVDIVNSSQVQATYKITLVNKRMTESGEFQDASVPNPDEKFADEVVKYSPRQVTLAPGAGQTIRMMFKAKPGLENGEYRSHLLFMKPPAAVTELPAKEDAGAKGLSVTITTNLGVSIPVIARHGDLAAQASIDPASVLISEHGSKQQMVTFALNRSGTRSIYGDIEVFRGKEKVAEANGVAVYTPNTRRVISLNLAKSVKVDRGDAIRVVFTERDAKTPLADATAMIP